VHNKEKQTFLRHQQNDLRVVRVDDSAAWDAFVCARAGHPLQLTGWARVKESVGWRSERLFVQDPDGVVIAGAQVLFRRVPWPFCQMAYIPRGPVVADGMLASALDALQHYLRPNHRLLYVLVEPASEKASLPAGWKKSKSGILLSRTLILDLTKTQETLLADITRKRRYDIRKSTQLHPDIRPVQSPEEVAQCLQVYQETAKRDGFHLHEAAYYQAIFTYLQQHSQMVAVWNEAGQPIAFTWLAVTPQIAFELYGGMTSEGQQRRANFALKWWCITYAQSQGVQQYDFNGLLNDGITTFKKSFASHENQLIGSFEYSLSPWYLLWRYALPWVRKFYRTLRSARRLVRR